MHPKILTVEDDHALRDVLRRFLSDEDLIPIVAADGASALRLATDDIAAAVLDVGLPDADGRTCAKRCAQTALWPLSSF